VHEDGVVHVVVIDDHVLVRQGIRNQLATCPYIQIMAEGHVGDCVLPLVEQYKPDVLLLDLRMPQSDDDSGCRFQALPTISRLVERCPETAVILLTQEYTALIVEAAIERGVQGYILKSDDLSQHIATAIVTVARGGVFFSETISAALFKRNQRARVGRELGLTERQVDILRIIATNPNDSYTSHAMDLGISESTFKNHLTRAFKTLDVKNATAAVIKCMQLGILAPPEIKW
jgi:DNA-binding NarL/FixJ family response regulator